MDCTSRAFIANDGSLFCNITSGLDLIQADGSFLRAFAIIAGVPVGSTVVNCTQKHKRKKSSECLLRIFGVDIAAGPPLVARVTSLAVVTPWNRVFSIPGSLNYYQIRVLLFLVFFFFCFYSVWFGFFFFCCFAFFFFFFFFVALLFFFFCFFVRVFFFVFFFCCCFLSVIFSKSLIGWFLTRNVGLFFFSCFFFQLFFRKFLSVFVNNFSLGINFCRANATWNTAYIRSGNTEMLCEGIGVTSAVVKCQLAPSAPLPLDLGDIFVTRVIANGVASTDVYVRIAFVTVPPGYVVLSCFFFFSIVCCVETSFLGRNRLFFFFAIGF